MPDDKTKEKILKDYKQKADAIVAQMYTILVRAQRKSDDKAYRKTLEKLQ